MGRIYISQLKSSWRLAILLITMNDVLYSQNINPDWNLPKGLVLVYPDRLPDNRKVLCTFYDSLIYTIIENAEIKEMTIICRPEVAEKIKIKFNNLIKTKFIVFPTNKIQDIWVRDFAPIANYQEYSVKAKYSPSYFNEKEKQFCDSDDSVGVKLTKIINREMKQFKLSNSEILVIDGGNFIHNGKGLGIVTNRVISDNESCSVNELKTSFHTNLRVSDLIILPVEPGDETGHVDGMIRFINENTVVVSKYPEIYESLPENISFSDYEKSQLFLDRVASELESKGLKVFRITNDIPKINSFDGGNIGSAVGNYLNYLRIGDVIFVPQYGSKYDVAIQKYKELFPSLIFVPVNGGISKLAELGGVLNCISWTY